MNKLKQGVGVPVVLCRCLTLPPGAAWPPSAGTQGQCALWCHAALLASALGLLCRARSTSPSACGGPAAEIEALRGTVWARSCCCTLPCTAVVWWLGLALLRCANPQKS